MSLLHIANEVIDLSNGATAFLEKFYDMDNPLPTDEEFLTVIISERNNDNSKMPNFADIYMNLLSENIYSSLVAFYSSDEFANKLNDIYIKKIGKADPNVDVAIANVLKEIDENVFTDIVDDCYEPFVNSVATNYKLNIKNNNGETIQDILLQNARYDDISDALVKNADNKCDLISKIDNEYKHLLSIDNKVEKSQENHSAPTL